MGTDGGLRTLGADGLRQFQALQADAVRAVTDRFYATHGSAYERFGPRGREACREDLAFHLEFLRPVLEFGLLQPMVDYLRWLGAVLAARAIPAEHLGVSLDWLAEFFTEQMEVADGAVVGAALTAARTAFAEKGEAVSPAPPDPWPEAAAFEAALLAGRQRDAVAVVERCLDQGRTLVAIEMHVIQAALYRIGEKWQANQVSVAQEHMATAIVRSVMTVGLLRCQSPAPIDKKVLLACVDGNAHDIGLRIVADAFQLAGWEVQYLGGNVPTPSLLRHTEDWRPHLLGLSVSFPQQLRGVRDIITQLSERLGEGRPAVMVGGLAINRFTQLAQAVGADGCSVDAQTALADASRLVSA